MELPGARYDERQWTSDGSPALSPRLDESVLMEEGSHEEVEDGVLVKRPSAALASA